MRIHAKPGGTIQRHRAPRLAVAGRLAQQRKGAWDGLRIWNERICCLAVALGLAQRTRSWVNQSRPSIPGTRHSSRGISFAVPPSVIEELLRLAAADPRMLSLAGAVPAKHLLPRGALGRAFVSSLGSRGGPATSHPCEEALRAWIAARIWSRGGPISKDEVILTSGARRSIAIAAELLLAPGDEVSVDPWCYSGALGLFRSLGAEPIADSPNARVVYVMPGVSNPIGVGIDDRRRRQLLSSGAHLVADEAHADLRFDGRRERPLLADARDRTWHIGTFSKTLCRGLRVGYLVPPPRYLARARSVAAQDDSESTDLIRRALAQFLANDNFEARLDRARRYYERRAGDLVRALRRRFPGFRVHEPEGGLTVVVETDREGDEVALLELAVHEGVSFDPGSAFRADGHPSPVAMRLSFSSISPMWVDEACARLERSWNAWSRGAHRGARPRSDIVGLRPNPDLLAHAVVGRDVAAE